MEISPLVAPQNEHERNRGAKALSQRFQRHPRIGGAEAHEFEGFDSKARHFIQSELKHGEPHLCRGDKIFLPGIPGRKKINPHQPKRILCCPRESEMTFMNGVESAAEKSDSAGYHNPVLP